MKTNKRETVTAMNLRAESPDTSVTSATLLSLRQNKSLKKMKFQKFFFTWLEWLLHNAQHQGDKYTRSLFQCHSHNLSEKDQCSA